VVVVLVSLLQLQVMVREQQHLWLELLHWRALPLLYPSSSFSLSWPWIQPWDLSSEHQLA